MRLEFVSQRTDFKADRYLIDSGDYQTMLNPVFDSGSFADIG